MQKSAFTMIELIFVIVILGILAAVAIPKLSATRDDALVSKELNNANTAKQDMAAYYIAKGKDAPAAKTDCFNFTMTSGLIKASKATNNSAVYCSEVYSKDLSNDILASRQIGGLKVKF